MQENLTSHSLRKQRLFSFVIIVLGAFVVGCTPSAKLKKDIYLLGKQSFEGNNAIKKEELEKLLPEKPNKKLFGIPGVTLSLWIYQAFDQNYDRSVPKIKLDSIRREYEIQIDIHRNNARKLAKIRRKYSRLSNKYQKKIDNGNWWMRTFGEPPVYYDERNVRANLSKIKNYLVNQGYRDARVSAKNDTAFGRININYNIVEKLPHRLKEIDILTHTDSAIDSLLEQTKNQSAFKSGNNYRYTDVEREVQRIELLMQENGYYGFTKNYLRPVKNTLGKINGGFLVDTLQHDPTTDSLYHIINIKGLQINYPYNQTFHRQYKFKDVSFSVENIVGLPDSSARDSAYYGGVNYYFSRQHYYSPKVLDTKIFIKPNKLFRISDFRETQRQLSVLDQFKFINVETDTLDGNISARIRVIPQDKYQITGEGGVNVVQNLPGPFANGTFRIRNIFKRLENFEFSLRGAFDAQIGLVGNQDLIRTLELGANTALIFPRIVFPGKIASRLDRLTPRTIVSLGYNYTNRPEFKRGGLQASLRYSWKRSDFEYLSLTAADFSVLNSEKSASFSAKLDSLYLQNGNPLKFSFESAVISSMSFSYVFNNNIIGQNRNSHYWRLFFESGGTAFNLLKQQKLPIFLEGFEIYKFLKANAEYRKYIPIGSKSSIVYRINSGIIFNYNNRRVAPYEKSLTGGGSNSLRAWPPRRLGLGSAYPNLDLQTGSPLFKGDNKILKTGIYDYGSYDYRLEQLGDLLLETNVELRGHLFKFVADVNYAIFLDAGNVWRLRLDKAQVPDQNTLNSMFSLGRFYKEFAVGTGAGLRFDMSYFILRFDVGVKIYDPSRRFEVKNLDGSTTLLDERYLLPRFSFKRSSSNYPVFNIGVGYPF